MNPKGKGKRPSPAIISLHCDRERCLLQQVNTEQEEEPIFPTSPFPTSKDLLGYRNKKQAKKKEPGVPLVPGRSTEEPVAGRGEVFNGYSGKRKTKEKLRTRKNKNERETQSSGSRATALAPQMDLFGEASRGGGKGIFSLGSVECKEEKRQVGQKRTVAQIDTSRAKG